MGWVKVTYLCCGHTKSELLNTNKKTDTYKGFCEKCEENFSDWGIEVPYSEFKELERLGYKSIKNSYNEFDKTIYVKGKDAQHSPSFMVDHRYAEMLRTQSSKATDSNMKKDLEEAAAAIDPLPRVKGKHYRQKYPLNELSILIDHITKPKQHMDAILKRVSNVLGRPIGRKPSAILPYTKKIAGKPMPSSPPHGVRPIRGLPAKKKTTSAKKTTTKTQTKRKPIKDQPGYTQIQKNRKGYCVPEVKQHYWKKNE